MKLQILGTGCAKCNQLSAATQCAADRLGLDYEMEKITDSKRFAEFGVMVTPALLVDGKLKVSGRVPGVADLETLLAAFTAVAADSSTLWVSFGTRRPH